MASKSPMHVKNMAGSIWVALGAMLQFWLRTILKVSNVWNIPELGMEAIWKIEVEDFPAFILVDDKGNDFLKW